MKKNTLIVLNINCLLIQLCLLVSTFLPFIQGTWIADWVTRVLIIIIMVLLLINIYMESAGRNYTGKWGRPLSPARFSIGLGVGIFISFILDIFLWRTFGGFDSVVILYIIVQSVTGILAIAGGVLSKKSD